jgi:diguanylate cyclase (GGDEF)-like protein
MTTSEQGVVENLAKRCIEKIKQLAIPHQFSDTAEHITISIGIATIDVLANQQPSRLIKQADSALYQSKENGRNQYTYAPILSTLI